VLHCSRIRLQTVLEGLEWGLLLMTEGRTPVQEENPVMGCRSERDKANRLL
jgi:hypothetical protein